MPMPTPGSTIALPGLCLGELKRRGRLDRREDNIREWTGMDFTS